MSVDEAGMRTMDRKGRRVVMAWVHETAALLLAAAALVSGGDQLRQAGWGAWANPLFPAAAIAVAAAVSVWAFPALPVALHRSLSWVALALATPTAFATMTAIDFSVLLACQLLVIAAVIPEVASKRRVALFLWAVPLGTVVSVVAYVHTFMDYRPL